MNDFNVIVAAIGGLTLVLGLGSKRLASSPLPPTLLALACGVVVGPAVLGWIDPAQLGDRASILEKAARLTLGIGLVGVALRLPRDFPRLHWREMSVFIGLSMVLMWAISTALVFLILGLPFWIAALIAAAVTPTDPVASSPIVTGSLAERNLPDRIRHVISFDSGANDGLAYLFVFLPFLMLTRPAGEALSHWLTHTILWEVGAAAILGLLIGYGAGRLLRAAEQRDMIEGDWRLIYTVAMAFLAAGSGRLIGSDEVLVIFAAGMAFTHVVSESDRGEEERGQEAVNRFFSVPIFALLGTAIPWEGWRSLGWSGVLCAVAILLLRRIPVLLLLRPLLPSIRSVREALFVGWFGPIAVAAIYYAGLMEHKLDKPEIWHVTSLVVCASVIAHGMTGAPLTRLFGRRSDAQSKST